MILSTLVQIITVGRCINNKLENECVPSASDTFDYLNRASTWEQYGFEAAFSDAYRMPGYPAFLGFIGELFPGNIQSVARIAQAILLAISAVIVFKAASYIMSQLSSLASSLIYLFLPQWYFTPLLIAESLSGFFFCLLLLQVCKWIASRKMDVLTIIGFVLTLGVLVYLKPNQIILFFPIALTILAFNWRRGIFPTIAIFIGLLMVLAPWVMFTSKSQGHFVGLATTSGSNLYVGTGMVLIYDGGVLAESAIRRGVDQKSNENDILVVPPGVTTLEESNMYTKRAFEIWLKRPLKQTLYGFDKTLYSLSLKADSNTERVLGFCLLVSLAGLGFTSKNRIFYMVTVFSYATLATLMLQAFIFQADRRFVMSIFLPLAALGLGRFSVKAMRRIFSQMRN